MTGLWNVRRSGEYLGLRDERAIRRIMVDAGAYRVARQLRVDPDDLRRWLEGQRVQEAHPVEHTPTMRRRVRRTTTSTTPLVPGWWRETEGAAS